MSYVHFFCLFCLLFLTGEHALTQRAAELLGLEFLSMLRIQPLFKRVFVFSVIHRFLFNFEYNSYLSITFG